MERLDVFNCSNILIASYFTDNRGCAHENRDHTLIYLISGELEKKSGERKPFFIRESVLSCDATTVCGCRKK